MIEQKVRNLVESEFKKMKFSKKYSNQAILANRCQSIIYNEWGISNDYLWKLVDKYVEEFIKE